MENFSNNFLLSMPHLNESVFSESLIYICTHDNSGAMGIIINKPIETKNIQNILKETGLNQLKREIEIYLGGPVDVEIPIFLHDKKYQTTNTLSISKTVSMSSNIDIIEDIKKGTGPDKFKFMLGYSGWGKGQLEKEIENGDWLLIPANDYLIFNTPSSKIFQIAQSLSGIDIKTFTGGMSGLS